MRIERLIILIWISGAFTWHIRLIILFLMQNVHNSSKLSRIVVQLFEKRSFLFGTPQILIFYLVPFLVWQLLNVVSPAFLLSLLFASLSFQSQGFFNLYVCVNDEGNNDVDKDQVGQLHERDKVEEHAEVLVQIKEQLVHVDELFPIVLPHNSEQRINRHQKVIKIKVNPFCVDVVRIRTLDLVKSGHRDYASKSSHSNWCIEQIKGVKGGCQI